MTARQYEKWQTDEQHVKSAEDQAREIIVKAEEEAERIRKTLAREVKEHKAQLRNVADSQLEQFVDQQRIEKSAQATYALLATSTRIRADFDAMEPWLTELLETTVRKVVGNIPASTFWTELLTAELQNMRDRWNLILRCAPEDMAELEKLRQTNEALMSVVKEVQSDPDLPPKSCLVINANGALDIGIETRLNALRDVLTKNAERYPQ